MIKHPSRERNPVRLSTILCIATFTIVYLATRIYGITHFPIFVDEAIHVDWARATAESLAAPPGFDGRWLSIKLFAATIALRSPVNDLIAARIVVVIFGLATLGALFLLARDLFSTQTGILAVALYLLAPFTVIYTSMAMTDAIQLAFSTWAVWFAVRLCRNENWVDVVGLPLALALAFLAKISAAPMFLVPALAILILTPRTQWMKTASRSLPAFITSITLFIIAYKLGLFQILQYKVSHDFGGPVDRIWTNSLLASEWLWGLLTPSIAILSVVAFIWLVFIERTRAGLFVFSVLCLTVLPYVIGSEIWYPRYLLSAVIPIFLAVSRFVDVGIVWLKKRWGKQNAFVRLFAGFLVAAVLSWPMMQSAWVLFDLTQATLPKYERFQLVSGWPSGFGVKELVAFLNTQSQSTAGGINVMRLHLFDHPRQSLNIFLSPSPNISLYTIERDDREGIARLESLRTRPRTLLVLRTENGVADPLPDEVAPFVRRSTLIWSYTRPGGTSGLAVYELKGSP